ncbi:D-isomer specific 2-hydroxyacid dehydrogenase NAD-binding [Acidimicrobium ferrooxidans DSM 10331]|uniref:D-isomer specific 2-hydroxyacid dehydrogenase NAD-binding n=1 Tax=Acidimicrobium ferrooxidans (strain DSM 10331 / JCM 15462 / NBRC 103882 / ICP) TaxID=525909 RepID=C7M1K2_ACIFD|nr:2-hydroxyacid dehydrogenase [Acidimicrobium ferrooxidans]ACU53051.1 D-isomer specific 2-hydroxyacid dehydrogenase NAD-binding [Acidimicrobium ferrooxidans DSM 10331]
MQIVVPTALTELITRIPDAPIVTWDPGDPIDDRLAMTTFFVPAYAAGGAALEPLPRMRHLEVLQLLTAGVDRVVGQIGEGVTLCNARGVHDDATAELAVALLLAATRGLSEFALAQHEGRWERRVMPSLAGARVAIIGYGAIGRAIEARLAPFGVEIVRVARTPRFNPDVLAFDEFAPILPTLAGIVVVVPLTDATRHLIDAALLARLPDGAVVVNVARGPVVDTEALVAELASGRLRAGLDVTDPEPLPPFHPLWHLPNVVLTPHVGGDVAGLETRASALVERNVRRYMAGLPLLNVVRGEY